MKSEFEVAFNEIAELRALPRETVLEALSTALVSAYRRDAGVGSSQRVEANFDLNTGRARIFVEKEVVDQVQDKRTEVELEKARYYEPEANLGDMVMVQAEGTTKKFGRIAAQTAKQVILQKIREAERNSLYEEFVGREGEIVNGLVQSINANMVTVSLGRAEAILPRAQQIPGERYKPHDKIRIYIMEVKRSSRGPQIIASRSHRNMLRRLLEFEVPEIFNGQVEIKNIAREAGYRSKVAVAALQEGIDPVGACVGMRGIRIQNIVKELHEEKIDVIEWNPNQEVFIAKALSPARVSGVYLEDDFDNGRTAVVIVPDEQLSLAIGREGQNARLAAKLTGWRIDIKSVTEAVQEALEGLSKPPLKALEVDYTDLLDDVRRIIDKRAANKAVMPEEFTTLAQFADTAQRLIMAAREAAREARLAEINAVKSTLPPAVFQLSVETLDLPESIMDALRPLENVGEVMWRFLLDENRLQQMLRDCPADALQMVQVALDAVVIPDDLLVAEVDEQQPVEEPVEEPTQEPAQEPIEEPIEEPIQAPVDEAPPAEAPMAEVTTTELEPAPEAVAEPTAVVEPEPVVVEEVDAPEVAPVTPSRQPAQRPQQAPAEQTEADVDFEAAVDDYYSESESDSDEQSKRKRAEASKKKKKGRQLVYDEEVGGVVVKRRRKGNREREDDWDS
ncbi:MAG: transcription termination/antitermination protein NusA [Chloroflexi bacterium]|nr:transcription termination/antitermination protein NusA [Chloroflexota bacterium]